MEDGQIIANWAQLMEDNINIVVPVNNHSLENDQRSLIPFIEGIKYGRPKYGMLNKSGEIIVPAKYDYIDQVGEWVKVGVRYSYGVARKNGTASTYDDYKYGIMTVQGNFVLEPKFRAITASEDLFVVQRADDYCWGVLSPDGNEIVPFGKYSWIDGFDSGLARVKSGEKWGVINEKGEEVLPVEYDNIWNFFGRNRNSTKVVKGSHEKEVYFHDLNPELPVRGVERSGRHNNQDGYGTHYGEYAGSYAQGVMGYSDDVINDAFEGDPDAYWNID